MPSKKPATQPTESFLYRVDGDDFELFISIPNPPYDDLFSIPDFGEAILQKGLGMDYDDDWDWLVIGKRKAEKLAGRKIIGSGRVFHMWGTYVGRKKNPYASLQRLAPFEVNFIDVSAPKIAPVTEVPVPVLPTKEIRGRVVMTPETKAQVIQLLDAGHSGAAIAKAVGISLPSVMNIKKQMNAI